MFVNKSRFAKAVVKSGKRVTSSSEAQVVALSGYNMFLTNEPLRSLLGIDRGKDKDRVVMYDFALHATAEDVANGDAKKVGEVMGIENNNERFFISRGFNLDGEMQGAKVTQNGTFTYSPIWGAILNDDLNVKELNIRDLVERGILKKFTAKRGKTAHVGLKKAFLDVKPVYMDEDGNASLEDTGNPYMVGSEFFGDEVTDFDGNPTEVALFALTNIRIEDYEPNIEEGEAETEPEELVTEQEAKPKKKKG